MHYVMGPTVVTDLWLYTPAGNFGRWAASVNRNLTRNTERAAPSGADTGRVRKSRANAAYPVGSLKALISGSSSQIGPRQLEVTVRSGAPYTMFVVRGTGTIFSKSARIPAGQPGGGRFREGRGLYIPANPGWGPSMRRQRVSGQQANNFFATAFKKTSAVHSSLRGAATHMG